MTQTHICIPIFIACAPSRAPNYRCAIKFTVRSVDVRRTLKFENFFAVSSDDRNNGVVSWLCWMHFAWGMASSMIFSLLPLFIVDELGGSSRSFGMLEGAVIFLSFMAKLFAGFIMDIFKKKLPMLRTGVILTVLSKFFLACP